MIDADHLYRTIISRVIESGGLYTTTLFVWVVYLVIPGCVSYSIRYAVVKLLNTFPSERYLRSHELHLRHGPRDSAATYHLARA